MPQISPLPARDLPRPTIDVGTPSASTRVLGTGSGVICFHFIRGKTNVTGQLHDSPPRSSHHVPPSSTPAAQHYFRHRARRHPVLRSSHAAGSDRQAGRNTRHRNQQCQRQHSRPRKHARAPRRDDQVARQVAGGGRKKRDVEQGKQSRIEAGFAKATTRRQSGM